MTDDAVGGADARQLLPREARREGKSIIRILTISDVADWKFRRFLWRKWPARIHDMAKFLCDEFPGESHRVGIHCVAILAISWAGAIAI